MTTIQADIRQVRPSESRAVEELTRDAFWNLYVPGCDEHYLAHTVREHPDYIPDLELVALVDGRLVGSIICTSSRLVDPAGISVDTLTFGPLCVHPDYQRRGIGTALIARTRSLAEERAYPAIVILGDPHNYCKSGFRNCVDLNVSDPQGRHPLGLLVLPLRPDFFKAQKAYRFFYSDAYNLDPAKAAEFDAGFPPREKAYSHTQELFSMTCRAHLD